LNRSFFNGLLDQIFDSGRTLLDFSLPGLGQGETIEDLARDMLSNRGESSGVVLAQRILRIYRALGPDAKLACCRFLSEGFAADPDAVEDAARGYLEDPSEAAMKALAQSIEPPRQEFFRRLNLAPGGTAKIVDMRADLLDLMGDNPDLRPVDEDIVHLFGAWFNRGFLVPQRIDWATPATVLEKIIEYEAVHEIRGWDDLKRRLDPADRRCYGFFHPSLIDEPLIFVEVALTPDIPGSIQELIDEKESDVKTAPTTAVFYSISNCQRGLAGISFGSFLIKQVATDLAREMPSLKTFVTLSPMPSFARWLDRERKSEAPTLITQEERATLETLDEGAWYLDGALADGLKDTMTRLGAYYLAMAKNSGGRPADPVARFHLGNGARLERINWLADVSERGMSQSYGMMVNYLYVLKDIERNHEAFANDGKVTAAGAVTKLARAVKRQAGASETTAV